MHSRYVYAREKDSHLHQMEARNLQEKLQGERDKLGHLHQALEGRAGTLELSQKVNAFQGRIKDVTRKMMATVSELSMSTGMRACRSQTAVEKRGCSSSRIVTGHV